MATSRQVLGDGHLETLFFGDYLAVSLRHRGKHRRQSHSWGQLAMLPCSCKVLESIHFVWTTMWHDTVELIAVTYNEASIWCTWKQQKKKIDTRKNDPIHSYAIICVIVVFQKRPGSKLWRQKQWQQQQQQPCLLVVIHDKMTRLGGGWWWTRQRQSIHLDLPLAVFVYRTPIGFSYRRDESTV